MKGIVIKWNKIRFTALNAISPTVFTTGILRNALPAKLMFAAAAVRIPIALHRLNARPSNREIAKETLIKAKIYFQSDVIRRRKVKEAY